MPDGDASLRAYDREGLLKQMEEDLRYKVKCTYLSPENVEGWLDVSNMWPGVIVIKGEVVVPKPKKVVESLDIP